MKENHTPAISEDDYGLGLKVHEDAYRELEEEAERYRLEANAMMMQRDRLDRKLDEALSDLEFRRDLFKLQEQQLNDVRAEHNEARETAERYRLEANSMMMQRDRLAEELKEAQDAIEMMLKDSSCRRIPACTKEQLAAVKGGEP